MEKIGLCNNMRSGGDDPVNYNTTKLAIYETLKRLHDEGALIVVRKDDEDGWTIKAICSVHSIGMDEELKSLFNGAAVGNWR